MRNNFFEHGDGVGESPITSKEAPIFPSRAREVRRYVRRHRLRRWVWLDDDPIPISHHLPNQSHLRWSQRARYPYPIPPEHYVQTKWHVRHTVDGEEVDGDGLSELIADRAIAILNAPCPIITRTNIQIVRLCAEYDAIEKEVTDRHPWQGVPGECCLNCIYTNNYERSSQVQRVRQIIKLLSAHDECRDDELLGLMKKRLQDLE